MKGFFGTLIVVGLIIGGLWYAYDPYIEPLLDKNPTMSENDTVIGKEAKQTTSSKSADNSYAPKSKAPGKSAPSKSSATASKPAAPKAAPKTELDLLLEEKYPMPDVIPLLEIVSNWTNVPKRAYPAEVFAKETVAFQLVVNGQAIGSSNVAPGTPLTPISFQNGQIQVGNKANSGMSTMLPVEKTDFKERIEKRYNDYVEKAKTRIATQRARVKEVVQKDPAKLAALKGEAPPATAANDSNDPRFSAVKTSLRNGEAASVTLEEATSFTWNGSEKIGGEKAGTYETVTVHFEVATIFGRFPVDYKALLQGGRVVGWIDPITEDRI